MGSSCTQRPELELPDGARIAGTDQSFHEQQTRKRAHAVFRQAHVRELAPHVFAVA